MVAIASRTVFLFVCTVDAVCTLPFPYLVLSEPKADPAAAGAPVSTRAGSAGGALCDGGNYDDRGDEQRV